MFVVAFWCQARYESLNGHMDIAVQCFERVKIIRIYPSLTIGLFQKKKDMEAQAGIFFPPPPPPPKKVLPSPQIETSLHLPPTLFQIQPPFSQIEYWPADPLHQIKMSIPLSSKFNYAYTIPQTNIHRVPMCDSTYI